MKKYMRSFIGILIVLAMLICVVPPAFAAGENAWTSLTQHYDTDVVFSTGACEDALNTANFCLHNAYIAKGDYSIRVDMQGTMGMPNTKHVQEGIIPWYLDNNNFLYAYVEWSDTERPSDIRQMHVSGKVNGEHIGWNDIWCDGIHVAQNEKLTLKVDKITAGGDVKLQVALYQGETEVKAAEVTLAGKAEAMNQDGAKMGVYGFGDIVAFSGFTSNAQKAEAENGWTSLTEHYITNGVLSSGACEGALDTANFCLNSTYVAKGDYTVSVKMRGTMGMPNTKHVQEGIIPWYVDNNNFLYVYVEWSDTERNGDIRQMHVSGKVNGEHIGWNDIWCDGIHVAQNNELTLKVDKATAGADVKLQVALYQGETEVKAAEVTLAGKAEAMNQDGAKMGVYAFGDSVAFYGFASTAEVAQPENPEQPEKPEQPETPETPKSDWTSLTEHYTINGSTVTSSGACEAILNTTNFALHNYYSAEGDLTLSVKMQGTMGLPNTKHVQEGIIPWYVDENNYLFAYVQWADNDRTGDIHQMHISGKIDGQHLGWGDIWCDGIVAAQNEELTLTVQKITEGQNVKLVVTLSRGSEVLKTGERVFEGKAEALSKPGKVGVYAFNDTVTFSNFTSNGPDSRLVPPTGDTMPIFAVVVCMSMAAIAILVCAKKRCYA